MVHIREDDIDVTYTPRFVDPAVCERMFPAILSEAAWSQPTVTVFGRKHLTPRLVAWHGDPGCTYRYSGQEHPWHPWTPALTELRRLVEARFGPQHAVLANHYRDGSDGIGAHADDEGDLEPGAPILMVSLGAVRNFVVKHRTTKARYVLPLETGSLLTMSWGTNDVAVHSVPKTKKGVGARISLTFRRMLTGEVASRASKPRHQIGCFLAAPRCRAACRR